MIYNSIAELPYFEQYKPCIEEVINELELENSYRADNGTFHSNNISILDSSRGSIQINRSEITKKKTKEGCKC